MRWRRALSVALPAATSIAIASGWGCSTGGTVILAVSQADAGPDVDAAISSPDLLDAPLAGLSPELRDVFAQGDTLFGLALRDGDGLGPLYTQRSCSGCHKDGLRGPGAVEKMSVVLADGVTPAPDQSKLPWGHTVHPLVTAAGKTPIVPPPGDSTIRVTTRIGPPVGGRGYMEAILESEILRVEAEQKGRGDAIHGRVNRTAYQSEANTDTRFHAHRKGDIVIGRFGYKARVATLDDFTADALQGDMGITSPLRPVEFANPDGLTDDAKPGVDVTFESVNLRAMYVRMLAIPRRAAPAGNGAALFAQAKCSVCHVPSLKTRADYPIPVLAGVDAPVFTDLLLHDMGDLLADGLGTTDGDATYREWRTAPLIGLRFAKTFLHDGRAATVEDAILAHEGPGSQASEAVRIFRALPGADRQSLLDYIGGL